MSNQSPSSTHFSVRHLRLMLLLGIISVILTIGFKFHTVANRFPFYYSPMELTKTHHIVTNRPNFKHPAFIITTTRLVALLSGYGTNLKEAYQPIVVMGRTLNAVYAAIALGALMILLYHYRGLGAVFLFGVASLFSHSLLDQAHLFKEEMALFMGTSLVLLAGYFFCLKPAPLTLTFLALTCAIALSAKWPGIVIVVLAFLMFLQIRRKTVILPVYLHCFKFLPGQWFALVFGLTFLIFNYQIFFRYKQLFKGIFFELRHISTGTEGLTYLTPYLNYWYTFQQNTPFIFQLLLTTYFIGFALTWRKRTPHECLEVGFIALFTSILCMAKYASPRYLLAIEILASYLGSKGLYAWIQWASQRWSLRIQNLICVIVALGLALWVGFERWPAYQEHLHSIQFDTRSLMQAWVNRNLFPKDKIVADGRIALPAPNSHRYHKLALKKGWAFPTVPQVLYSDDLPYVYNYESLDHLRNQGVTHVAIRVADYERFNKQNVQILKSYQLIADRQLRFYQELQQQKLVWQWAPSGPYATFAQPSIKIWDIRFSIKARDESN